MAHSAHRCLMQEKVHGIDFWCSSIFDFWRSRILSDTMYLLISRINPDISYMTSRLNISIVNSKQSVADFVEELTL